MGTGIAPLVVPVRIQLRISQVGRVLLKVPRERYSHWVSCCSAMTLDVSITLAEYGSTQESAYTSQIAPDIPVGSPKASKLSSKERRKATFTHKKIQESRAMRKEKKRNKEEEEKQERNPHGQSFTNKADDVPETGNSLGSKPSHWETQSLWDMANGPLRQCWLPLLYRWDGWNWVPLPGGYYLLPQPSTPPYHPSYLNQPQDFEYPGYSQHSSTLYDSKDASDAAWPMESSPALTEKGPNTSRPKGEVPAIRIDDSLLIAVSPTPALHKSNSPTTELVTDARKESRLSLSTPNDSNTSPPDAVVATGLNDLAAIGAQHDEANTGAVIEPRDFDVTADVNDACNLPLDYVTNSNAEIDSIIAVGSSITVSLQGRSSTYPTSS
ncbi:hypothetical protein P171DRAFT_52649 [Karstenula rhodostoma CBS 690.94]|uniref:Uncharacterized protein n=1 Tax=Karstenula rhodostoma CBS 690.94 TaxID=1392251 RepID=A0A9P4PFC2_9PLEO|nr:hypothetical protein P171DRAFT_52649 [Karstenula rhodostoma CBS 690.94]